MFRSSGLGADAQQEVVGGDVLVSLRPLDDHFMGTCETRLTPQQLDAVAVELVANHFPFMVDNPFGETHQVGNGNVFFDSALLAEHSFPIGPRQMEYRLAEGFGGDRAGVDLCSAEHLVLFNDGDPLAELGGLNGPLLTRGTGADHNAIVMFHVESLSPSAEARRGLERVDWFIECRDHGVHRRSLSPVLSYVASVGITGRLGGGNHWAYNGCEGSAGFAWSVRVLKNDVAVRNCRS